jgi:iron transport multicopper oxidase
MKTQLIFPWFGCLPLLAQAATVTYNFNLTWVYTNPDGLYNRPTIGINGQWPLPRIEVDINDHVVVNIQNHLGNRSATLHFHGLYMHGSNLMDGPDGVTQCEFNPDSAFTYEFDVSFESKDTTAAK